MIRRQKLKILVTDDSSVVRHLLVLWLHKMCACDVDTASDGLVAMQKLSMARDAGTPYDLMITDLSMPNLNGVQLIELVRKSESSEKLPILVLTTFSATEYREKAKTAGATDYLTKPLRYYELFRAVQRLFPEADDHPSPVPYMRRVMAG